MIGAAMLAFVAASMSAQATLPPTLRLGDRVSGELARSPGAERNPNEVAYRIPLTVGETLTLSLESFDFDAELDVEAPGTARTWRERLGGVYTDARLELTAPTTELLVHVRSEDARGGEYTLSAVAGPVGPKMERAEWVRRSSEHCELGAERAIRRGDAKDGLRSLSDAWQFARELGDLARERRLVELQEERAREAALPGEILRAQVHRAMTERQGGNAAHAAELLHESCAGLDELIAAAPAGDEQRTWVLLACAGRTELGDIAQDAEDWAAARECYQRAIDLAAMCGDARFEALSWSKLANALDQGGDLAQAQVAADRAHAVALALNAPQILSRTYFTRGRVHARRGELRAARTDLEQGLTLEASPDLRAVTLGTLADVYVDLARYESASCALEELEHLVQARDLAQQSFPTQLLRARIAFGLGEFPRARAILERALQEARDQGRRTDEARVLMNLGTVLTNCGDPVHGRERLEESLQVSEETGDRVLQLRALVELGEVHQLQGDFDAALEPLEKARALADELGIARYAATIRGALAFVLCRRGGPSPAHELAQACARDLEGLEDWNGAADAHETLARIALASRDVGAVRAEIDAGEALLGKGEDVGLDALERATLRSRSWTWSGIAQDLVALELQDADLMEADRARILQAGCRATSRWKGRAILEGLGPRDPSISVLEHAPAVRRDEMWIDYVDGLEHLYAYVATSTGLRFIDLGERDSVERVACHFVAGLATPTTAGDVYASEAALLHERLLAPILANASSEFHTLVVCPTPALAVLPFGALVAPDALRAWDRRDFATLHCVIDDYEVIQAPSMAVVAALAERPRAERAPHYLVLGDALYYPETQSPTTGVELASRVGESLLDYPRLKGTREETLEIADLLLARNRDTTDAERALLQSRRRDRSLAFSTSTMDLVMGSQASLERVADHLSEYTHLHIAAHARVDLDDPRRSGLVLAYEPRQAGLWSLEDVLQRPLTADLVVLSACESAAGPIVRGEGVQSIAHAFLSVGAGAVIATLWRVDDHDAAELMKDFYARMLEQGVTPARALHAAQLALRHRQSRGLPATAPTAPAPVGTHPYYWAPYIFVGAPPR